MTKDEERAERIRTRMQKMTDRVRDIRDKMGNRIEHKKELSTDDKDNRKKFYGMDLVKSS